MSYWSEMKVWLLKDPVKAIRYLVLFICSTIVIVQLYECFSKLNNPPISTHSYYNVNETIEMPAVTICRDPPYKEEELTKISGNSCKHPKYNSCWSKYPYNVVELKEFFTNSTFNENETFPEYLSALNGLASNFEITNSLNFYMGLCHTIRPKISLKRTSKSTGYAIMLRHHLIKSEINTVYYENTPGWHLFIHDKRENFTEINMKTSGRVEYIFADINEEIEIKLQSQYFSSVETKKFSCSRNDDYNDLKCGEVSIWHEVCSKTNCSGPWMTETNVSPCSDYKSMLKLIAEYGKIYNSEDDAEYDCIQPCESRIFSTYIQNRKAFNYDEPFTQLYIYYTTKLITMIEERPNYDTTQFIADVGGSLGFLLGLSVLGLITILEHIILFLCGGVIKQMQYQNEKRLRIKKDLYKNSETTIDIAAISKAKC